MSGQQPKPTKQPLHGINDAHTEFVAWLYESHGALYDENVKKFEGATGLKREQGAYGIGALLAFYLVAGSAAQLVCNLIGFAYPAYISVHAIRSPRTDDDTQWLIYWTVFACFSLVDFFAVLIFSYFPVYWLIKAAFLVYLYLPQTTGANWLFQTVVEPLAKMIDAAVEKKNA